MNGVRLKEISSWLDVTGRRVQQLAKEKVIPKSRRGFYDLKRCVVNYIRFLRGTGETQDLQQVRVRHLTQRTKKLEVETSQLEGSLILKTELQRLLKEYVSAAQTAFSILPAQLSAVLVQLREPDQKLISYIIQYAIQDTIRHELGGIPRPKTETISPWQVELLALGLIRPDADGEVIEETATFPFRRRRKAADLIKHWQEVNEKHGRSPEGNTNSLEA